MDLVGFLLHHGISFDQILAEANAAIHLAADDVLFIGGSLVDGHGNEESDVDLFLITSRQDVSLTSLSSVIIMVGPCLIDILVYDRGGVEKLLGRFEDWSLRPREPRNAFEFNDDERKFLYRLQTGRPIHGQELFSSLTHSLRSNQLARHRLDYARHYAGNLQIDMAGFRRAGDHCAMLFAAQAILGHTIDALLAGHGFSNPLWKWRVDQLRRLGDDWEDTLPGRRSGLTALDQYLALHRTPERMDPRSILEFGLRISAFARRVFPWAERLLLCPSMQAFRCSDNMPLKAGQTLPCLDLNVMVSCHEGRLELIRLNGRELPTEITPQAYSILCLFDGETSTDEAVRYAETLWEKSRAREIVVELIDMVHYARLSVNRGVDEDKLARILRA